MNRSKLISDGKSDKNKSRLIKSVTAGLSGLDSYVTKPNGVFGSVARIIYNGAVFDSDEFDIEFSAKFDDDMEANEAEITIYNLKDSTINQFKHKYAISIEAGYEGDTGVIFQGFVTKVSTSRSGADKVTTIQCIDSVVNRTVEEITYAAGTTASYILRDLLNRTGTPIAVFQMRRDHTFENDEKVDGDLMEAIKRYSDICGVSTFINKGKIYSRHIKVGDNISLTIKADTGLIGSPQYFEEEKTAEDFKETIKGYECEILLQHRISAGVIVNLTSEFASGQYRVCSGEHRFNISEAITEIKMY